MFKNCNFKLIYSIPKSGALMLSRLELERLSARNFCKLNDFFWEAPLGKYLLAASKVNKLLQEDIFWLVTGPITTEQKLYGLLLLQLGSSTETNILFEFKEPNTEDTKPESKSLTLLTVARDCLPV